ELSYFPAGAPLILSVQTDPNSAAIQNLQALLGHFPIAGFGEQALLQKLQQSGINYQTEIKPLLGNPVMVGFDSPSAGFSTNDALIVWNVGSSDKIATLLKRIPGLSKVGSSGGATIYNTGGGACAGVDGSTLVIAGTQEKVAAAIQRHANGSGFTGADYQRLVTGLPSDALLEVFGDLRGVLSSGSAAQARAIPWVGAIRGYAVSLSANASSLDLSFRVDTGGATLTSGQLPIAGNAAAPSFAGSMPITVGLTNPGQAISFIVQALKLTGSSSLAHVPAAGLGAISTLESQLSGNAILATDLHTTMFRAQLSNAPAALSELQTLLAHAQGSSKPVALGGGFYRSQQITFGIADGQLLIGRAAPAELSSFATAPTSTASGAQGSLA